MKSLFIKHSSKGFFSIAGETKEVKKLVKEIGEDFTIYTDKGGKYARAECPGYKDARIIDYAAYNNLEIFHTDNEYNAYLHECGSDTATKYSINMVENKSDNDPILYNYQGMVLQTFNQRQEIQIIMDNNVTYSYKVDKNIDEYLRKMRTKEVDITLLAELCDKTHNPQKRKEFIDKFCYKISLNHVANVIVTQSYKTAKFDSIVLEKLPDQTVICGQKAYEDFHDMYDYNFKAKSVSHIAQFTVNVLDSNTDNMQYHIIEFEPETISTESIIGLIKMQESDDGAIIERKDGKLVKVTGNIASFTIPDDITSIGANAFASCPKLEELIFTKPVLNNSNNAFRDAKFTKLILDGEFDNYFILKNSSNIPWENVIEIQNNNGTTLVVDEYISRFLRNNEDEIYFSINKLKEDLPSHLKYGFDFLFTSKNAELLLSTYSDQIIEYIPKLVDNLRNNYVDKGELDKLKKSFESHPLYDFDFEHEINWAKYRGYSEIVDYLVDKSQNK